MYDYLIVGGGIGGSILAYRLIKAGSEVLLADEPNQNISSVVAAGMINPVTGKRTVLTWEATRVFDAIWELYPALEQELQSQFFEPKPIYKLFETALDQNHWLEKPMGAEIERFVTSGVQYLPPDKVNNPFGALCIREGGRVKTDVMISALHHWLKNNNSLVYGHYKSENNSIITPEGSEIKPPARKIIFAEGTYAPNRKAFGYLPYKNVQGELLEVEIPGFYTDRIINSGIFVLPEGGNTYLVGATYNWDLQTPVKTEAAKKTLTEKLARLIGSDFNVTGHRAGIRPSTLDRRPFIGRYPVEENTYIFGGFGSKGASLVPYLSKVFSAHLLYGAELPPESDICRFQPQ